MGETHERDHGEARAVEDGSRDLGARPADRDDDAGVEASRDTGGSISVSFDLGVVIVGCYALAMLPAIIQAIRWW